MARFTILFAALATLATVAYRAGYSKGEDETITVSIPKGYSAPTPMPKNSWEDRMKQIMAHGLESEAVAAEAEVAAAEKPIDRVVKPAPRPSVVAAAENRVRPRRTLTTKTGRHHGHKSVGRTGRGRHGRHAR